MVTAMDKIVSMWMLHNEFETLIVFRGGQRLFEVSLKLRWRLILKRITRKTSEAIHGDGKLNHPIFSTYLTVNEIFQYAD